MKKILIIDDDPDICQLLKKFLDKNNYEASAVNDANSAIKILKGDLYDLVLCDYKLPDTNGIDLLKKIKIINSNTAVIIITGYSDIKIAVEALRYGAYDYVTKPLYPDEILITIKNAIQSIEEKFDKQKSTRKTTNNKEFVHGKSPQAKLVQKHINLIAPTDMSVIISGETGIGKEFVAYAIHEKSTRGQAPFVAIDCGAIPEELAGSELFGHIKGAFTGALQDKIGSFEVANRGTLFLDEIGNLSYDNQIKLLRVLQERKIKRLGSNKDIPIDVRVIVATNEDLTEAVRNSHFREDIYHRLNEFKIEIPPLRERREDIEIFARHFLEKANLVLDKQVVGFDDLAMDKINNYVWHGNLRELENVIKRAVLLCQVELITINHLPPEIVSPSLNQHNQGQLVDVINSENLKAASANAEKLVIINALKKAGYNKSKAAKSLKIDRKTLYNKLKAYEINI